MNDPAANLDRLHDLIVPPAVPWWPLAPGWYVVLALLLVIAIGLLCRAVARYRANAYRRAALRQLDTLDSATAIAELLRRTALVIAPRRLIAQKSGAEWLDWLATQCPEAMPDSVRAQLAEGVYRRAVTAPDLVALRTYAVRWIAQHPAPSPAPGDHIKTGASVNR